MISGHLHLRDTRTYGCVLQISCAALCEPPFEVTLLDVEKDEGRVSVLKESVQVLPSPVLRLPALSPAREEWVFEKGSWRPAEKAAERRSWAL